MQNKDMIIKSTEFYEGIENLVTPELFFDLMGWKDDKHGVDPIGYTISFYHHLVSEKIATALGVSEYVLSKGFTSLGVLALAKTHGLCRGQVKTVEYSCEGSRKANSKEMLKKASKGLENVYRYKRAILALQQLYLKYSGNGYISLLPPISNEKTKVITQKKIEILEQLKPQQGKNATRPLNDNMFRLARDKENKKMNTRVSSTIALINHKFRQKVMPRDHPSECYRGAHVAGLHIFSRWAHENKLSSIDEIHLGAIIQEIRMIITDFYE